MNILFVSDVSIMHATSGAERVLFEQSTRLQHRGHAVHILTRKLPEHQSVHEIIQGVNEWRYDANRASIASFGTSVIFKCRKLFETLHARFSFDVINFHQPFSAFGVVRSPASRTINKIYTCHSLSFEEFRSRTPEPKTIIHRALYSLNVTIRKSVEKRALTASEKIVVLSRFTRGKLKDVYGLPLERITVIPGGVDLKRFHPAVDKEITRRQLFIPEEKIMLLTVRDLEPRMGLENLIHAVKKVRQVIPDIYLIVGGKGPLEADLKSLTRRLDMEDCIHFTGFIPEEHLPDYYRMADFFILPTIELEGFGLITLEALASGIPVLGTPVGGTVEILNRFNPEYLFKDTEPESLAALMIETCGDFKKHPEHWLDVASQCRSFVEKNYSWETNVDLLEHVLM